MFSGSSQEDLVFLSERAASSALSPVIYTATLIRAAFPQSIHGTEVNFTINKQSNLKSGLDHTWLKKKVSPHGVSYDAATWVLTQTLRAFPLPPGNYHDLHKTKPFSHLNAQSQGVLFQLVRRSFDNHSFLETGGNVVEV